MKRIRLKAGSSNYTLLQIISLDKSRHDFFQGICNGPLHLDYFLSAHGYGRAANWV